MGRHTKLTPELQAKIVKLIEDGMFASVAAQACGIAEGTHYDWLHKGSDGSSSDPQGLYTGYREAVKKAESTLEHVVVCDVVKKLKASKNPIHAFIFLSRRFRDRWAETVNVGIATREGVAAMERIKEAWNAPAVVVEGEYREVDDGTRPKLEAAPGELVGSQNGHSATQSEASSSLGFHAAPPDDAPGEGAEATAEGAPDSPPGVIADNIRPPTNLLPTTFHEPSPVELSETKGVVVGRERGESELVKRVRARRLELEEAEKEVVGDASQR